MNRSLHALALGVCVALAVASVGPAWAQDEPDLHPELLDVNRAQLVMFSATGLLPADQIHLLAATLKRVAEEQSQPGAARSPSYNALEARLTELIGPVASNLRSWQRPVQRAAASRFSRPTR